MRLLLSQARDLRADGMLIWAGKTRPARPAADRRAAARQEAGAEEFLAGLVEAGRLDAAGAERARAALEAGATGLPVVLSELGLVPESDLVAALADFCGLAPFERAMLPEAAPAGPLDRDACRRCRLLPLKAAEGDSAVAAVDPLDKAMLAATAYALPGRTEFRVIGASAFEAAFRALWGDEAEAGEAAAGEAFGEDMDRLEDLARRAPVIRLANAIFRTAFDAGATDIHLEPGESELRVRFRVDGILVRPESYPKAVHNGLATRLKILAGLNIAERRLPQDGRIKMVDRGREVDVRVSVLPTPNGESLVLRLLGRALAADGFEGLGLSAPQAAGVAAMTGRPNGLFLVTGPTGSGKTTTLYTALNRIDHATRKVITVEDPVEYRIAGVTQVQAHAGIGLDYAAALRSILRQDPDVVMIGECRDAESARIAVQASLTGHLVLSTLHTNSAAAAVTRLADMGVERYLLAAVLNGVLAQRLLRVLCPRCRRAEAAEPEERRVVERLRPDRGGGPIQLARSVGCAACGGTGYAGRVAVAELLALDRTLRGMIADGAGEAAIEAEACGRGMRTLAQAGLDRALALETSLEEVLRHLDGDSLAAAPPPSRAAAS